MIFISTENKFERKQKNMKEKGVLLPIFSLPSKYGIGDFGYEAYEFIDILSKNNIRYWEILPINECNTHPYSPVSYYALEEEYISLDKLAEQGLIKEAETRQNKDRAIYDDFKEKYYKEAFENFKPDNKLFIFTIYSVYSMDGIKTICKRKECSNHWRHASVSCF